MALFGAPLSQTGSNLFQKIMHLQAQRPITTNPQYQPQPDNSLSTGFGTALFSSHSALPSDVQSWGYTTSSHEGFDLPSPEYYAARESVDPDQTLESFKLFLQLPSVIINFIVEQCPVADGVCLALTSKYMYTLARPVLICRTPEAFSLLRTPDAFSPWLNSFSCQRLSHPNTLSKLCPKATCKPHHRSHCLHCTSCQLWVRLRTWNGLSPKTHQYCPHRRCRKFNPRKKLYKGRCLHGGPLPKKRKDGRGSLSLTFQKHRGGFQKHGKFWKSLYTETDMAKALDRHRVARTTNSGYGLRTRPTPTLKRLEHVQLRCGNMTSEEAYSE